MDEPKTCLEGGKYHPNAEDIGECAEGCCDKYYCPDCKIRFRVEAPD